MTIGDVARRAGASTSSVTRHLRGDKVRAGAAIQSAIDELGYRPSALARSLKSGVTHTLGLVVPDVTNPYFAAIVKGVESVAYEAGYTVVLCNTDEDSERERAVLAAIGDRIDGLLLTPARDEPATARVVGALDLPVVFIDRTVAGISGIDAVLIDNVAGAAAAADHLIERGHRRLAIISGPPATTPGRERHEGFLDACRDDVNVEVEFGDFKEEKGYQAAMRLLGQANPPTALFVGNNLMTVGALRALRDLGIGVPDVLSIIGFDDLSLADLLDIPLTVIERATDVQGAVAARLLLGRLSGDVTTLARAIRLEPKLLERASTADIHEAAS